MHLSGGSKAADYPHNALIIHTMHRNIPWGAYPHTPYKGELPTQCTNINNLGFL